VFPLFSLRKRKKKDRRKKGMREGRKGERKFLCRG
jgi:hypothetical protein